MEKIVNKIVEKGQNTQSKLIQLAQMTCKIRLVLLTISVYRMGTYFAYSSTYRFLLSASQVRDINILGFIVQELVAGACDQDIDFENL